MIDALWEEYRKGILGDDAPAANALAREAFFAGARSLLEIYVAALQHPDDDSGSELLIDAARSLGADERGARKST